MGGKRAYWFRGTSPERRPSSWWYVGWVIYANLWGFVKAFVLFAGAGLALFGAGWLFGIEVLAWACYLLAGVGLLLLVNSIVGLTLVYGPPARGYLGRLLKMGNVREPRVVADLHIGTYRISYLLRDLLPSAIIESVDVWDGSRHEPEPNLKLLRALEAVPSEELRLSCRCAISGRVPLPDGSCDVVVFGLGLHEIPEGEPREEIFAEARRILKPGGTLLLFEHTVDLQSFLVFGPEIDHWVRRSEWLRLIGQVFGQRAWHRRSPEAVDLFAATKNAASAVAVET